MAALMPHSRRHARATRLPSAASCAVYRATRLTSNISPEPCQLKGPKWGLRRRGAATVVTRSQTGAAALRNPKGP